MVDNWLIGFELVGTDWEDVELFERYWETCDVFDLVVEQGEVGEVYKVFQAVDLFDVVEGEVFRRGYTKVGDVYLTITN